MELHYRLTMQDYFATTAAARRRTERLGGWRAPAAKAALIALVAGVLSFAAPTLAVDIKAVIVGFVVGAAMVVAMAAINQAFARSSQFRPDGIMLGLRSLQLDEHGLRFFGEQHQTLFRWDAFEEVTAGKGIVLLWFEPGGAYTVPDRAFVSPEQRAAFLADVQARIAAARPA
jgi:hypothetical protein